MKSADLLQTTQTLAILGVDSLVIIEIRNWWKTMFGSEVSILELQECGHLGK
jgi:aryl carrier-like protein